MIIAILGDTHFGMRNDSPAFHTSYQKFYNNVLFPTLEYRGVDSIIQLGDLFDRRKYINFKSLSYARDYFFDEIARRGFHMWTIVGNHDAFYKNTLLINSHDLLLKDYADTLTTISRPKTICFGGLDIDFIPWICDENKEEIEEFIRNSKSKVCCGHFQIVGFEQESGQACREGLERTALDVYDMVMTGHFHHKSSDGHIFYVGSPGEITWADYDEERGFHLFDTETRSLEFVRNPYRMHHKIPYNDMDTDREEVVAGLGEGKYKDTYIKVYVEHKADSKLFDLFINMLYKDKPLDITIIEQATISANVALQIDTTDTRQIINKCVDDSLVKVDKTRLKTYLHDLHTEALKVGK